MIAVALAVLAAEETSVAFAAPTLDGRDFKGGVAISSWLCASAPDNSLSGSFASSGSVSDNPVDQYGDGEGPVIGSYQSSATYSGNADDTDWDFEASFSGQLPEGSFSATFRDWPEVPGRDEFDTTSNVCQDPAEGLGILGWLTTRAVYEATIQTRCRPRSRKRIRPVRP